LTTSRRDVLLGTLAAVPALAAASVFGETKTLGALSWQLPAKRAVRVVENEWIPMPDGARLAARLWIPEGAEREPAAVVLEYIPYRKRDA
jgi:predicted acyl esterase